MALETKLNLTDETISALQQLIRLNIDSRDGFRFAADSIEDVTLQQSFLRFADQRQAQADELAQYVEWNGEESRAEGSYAAAMHRTWMTIREMMSGDDISAVLAEAERGEDQIKEAYEDSLRDTAGSAMNDVLLRQYADVKAVHDHIRDLRDMRKD